MRQEVKNLTFGMLGGSIVIAIYLLIIFSNGGSGDFNPTEEPRLSVQPEALNIYSARYASIPQGVNFVDAAESTVNAVVHIRTEMTQRTTSYDDFFGSLREYLYGSPYHGNQRSLVGFGSGVVLSDDGYIVTNNHVVEGADNIEVTFNDKRKMKATIVGTDPSTDIALIKVESKELPFLVFGNSDAVRVGEWVLAIGNPFNLNSTVTAGIVSAKARNINILGNRSSVDSFIQTDAVINRGNSGGALVNIAGELIGINAAIASQTGVYEGYSFAIPANIVKKVVDDIIRFGEPQKAFLGVEIREMNEELANEAGEKEIKGVYIARAIESGGAAEAGMKSGDVILEVNQRPVNTISQLLEAVGQYRPGDAVSVLALRKGKTINFNVRLRNQDGTTEVKKREEFFFNENLGVTLERLSASEKAKYNISNGLKVIDVEDGVLRRGGIGKDFIILQINGLRVDNKGDLEKAMNANRSNSVRVQGMYPNGMKISFEFMK
ncbi:MAG: deoxyribonuclease HsdR [Bacteroidetes bacterium HGW-Bacteroidetes-1]|jgi:Do/DeqQ family serine protease|nr:MAG: deoxyribonuclease HsdR [Bacteroidetes bacterium HGW-Bacteroidetes-1]